MSILNSSKQRVLGVILSYCLILSNTIVTFLYVPILLHYIGAAEYGIYRLFGSLIAYLGILDFGLSASITRFYIKYISTNELDKAKNLLSISFRLYSGISTIVIILGFCFYFYIPEIFSTSLTVDMIQEGQYIFLLLVFNTVVSLLSKINEAVIVSNEKFVFLKGISLLQVLIQPFIVVAFIMHVPYAITVVLVQSTLNLFLAILKYVYSKKHLGLEFKYKGWDKYLVRSLMGLSLSIFIVSVVDQVFWQGNQIIIGILLGPTQVAVYAIATQIYMNYMSLSLAISGVLLPKITSMVAVGECDESLNAMFINIGRYQYILLALVLSGFIVFGQTFIRYWVGDKFSEVYYIALWILIPFTIDLIQNTALTIMQAKEIYYIRAIVYAITGFFSLIFSYIAIQKYGILGGAVVTGISLFIGNGLIMNWYYHKYMRLDVIRFWRQIIKLSLTPLLLCVIFFFYFEYTGVLGFIVTMCGYFILYCVCQFFMLSGKEKSFFLMKIGF